MTRSRYLEAILETQIALQDLESYLEEKLIDIKREELLNLYYKILDKMDMLLLLTQRKEVYGFEEE